MTNNVRDTVEKIGFDGMMGVFFEETRRHALDKTALKDPIIKLKQTSTTEILDELIGGDKGLESVDRIRGDRDL